MHVRLICAVNTYLFTLRRLLGGCSRQHSGRDTGCWSAGGDVSARASRWSHQ